MKWLYLILIILSFMFSYCVGVYDGINHGFHLGIKATISEIGNYNKD